MQYSQQIILKRWIPILKEYERTKAKTTPRPFRRGFGTGVHIYLILQTMAVNQKYREANMLLISILARKYMLRLVVRCRGGCMGNKIEN